MKICHLHLSNGTRSLYRAALALAQKIVKVLRFYQRTVTCPMVNAQKLEVRAKRCQCPHSDFLVFAPPFCTPEFSAEKLYRVVVRYHPSAPTRCPALPAPTHAPDRRAGTPCWCWCSAPPCAGCSRSASDPPSNPRTPRG